MPCAKPTAFEPCVTTMVLPSSPFTSWIPDDAFVIQRAELTKVATVNATCFSRAALLEVPPHSMMSTVPFCMSGMRLDEFTDCR